MKEGFQGIEVIEKTRWEGDKAVGVEDVKRDEERKELNEKFEEERVGKDQKRHQMEERKVCCCGDNEKTM